MKFELNFDEHYVFGPSKTAHKYIYLRNQGIIVKRTLKGAMVATKILISSEGIRKYIKCIFLWFSIFFFPIYKFSQSIYLNNPNIYLAFFGRSGRVKIWKENMIINKVNDDFFSKTDYYMRKKLNKINITPNVNTFGKTFFSEEIIEDFTYAEDINIVKDKLNSFKNCFKTILLDKNYYINKLLNKIKRFNPKIHEKINSIVCLEKDKLLIRMSHGDLVKRNILVKNNSEPLMIDFEFSAYRSDFYDELFYSYFMDKTFFFKQKCNFRICVFLLERICLMLKLEQELNVSYNGEIDTACNYLNKNYAK